MHWWPRHTPRTGTPARPNSLMISMDSPASSGPIGPGEMMIRSIRESFRKSSSETLSFRTTFMESASTGREWYMFQTNES